MKILVFNSGSSSQKSALFDLEPGTSDDPVLPLWEGKLQWDGDKEELHISSPSGKEIRSEGKTGVHRAALESMLEHAWSGPTAVLKSRDEIQIVGHRIVHGGSKLTESVRVTAEVKREITNVAAIAPLHNQAGLQGIELAEKLLPNAPQIAVFDTGFHRTLPDAAFIYPVPYDWYEKNGIRRFGFHGINHEYCAHRAARMLKRSVSELKIVTCHLGNGCSLCAIDGGKSIDTTMGFTPLEGLMMGTRSGSIDPGILTHLIRTGEAKPTELDHVLNHQSGLLGISGLSGDIRDILDAMRKGNERAKLAFDIFVHRLASSIGAMAASLGGIDVLVFSAGIGENSPDVRLKTCASLAFLGIELDDSANASAKPDIEISPPDSEVRVLVIQAQEDWSIARECVRHTADEKPSLIGRLEGKVSINGDIESPIEPPEEWDSA
jgi:acetate kinase